MPVSERAVPRISVNKLGEYLIAKPSRRRRILEDAKRPPVFITARYREFFDVAERYFTSSPLDDNIVTSAIDSINARPVGTEWDEQNRALNCDLLLNLVDVSDGIDLDRYAVSAPVGGTGPLTIGGVDVSIRADLQLRSRGRGGESLGAIKFYTSKSFPLNQESGEYIATLLFHYCRASWTADAEVDYRHCFVIDVSAKEVFSAPRSVVRRMSDIEAACREISVLWPDI